MSETGVTRSRVVRSGFWALIARVLSAALGLALYALLARVMVQEEVGAYFTVRTLALTAAGLAGLGMGKVIIRFVGEIDAGTPGDRRRVIVRGVAIATASGLLGALGLVVVSQLGWFAEQPWIDYVPVLAVMVLLGAPRLVAPEGLRAITDVRGAALLTQTYPRAIITATLLVAFIAGATLTANGLLWVTAAVWGLVILVAAIQLRSKLPPKTDDPTIPSIKEYLLVGVPWLSTILVAFATSRFGVVSVAAVEGAAEAAVYGAAWNVAFWVTVPHAIVVATVQPFIVRLWAADEPRRLERLMRQAATGAGVLALALLVVFIVAGEQILNVLFGPEYGAGYGVLVILSIGHVIAIVTGTTLVLLALTGRQNAVMVLSLVLSPLVIALTLGLTLAFGSTGAAVGSMLGIAGMNIAGSVVVLRKMDIKTWAEPSLDFVTGIREVFAERFR